MAYVYASRIGNWGDPSVWVTDQTEPYGDGNAVAYNQVPQEGDTVFLNNKSISFTVVSGTGSLETPMLAAIYPGNSESNSGSGTISVPNVAGTRTIQALKLVAGSNILINNNLAAGRTLTIKSGTGPGEGIVGGTGTNKHGINNSSGGKLVYFGNIKSGTGPNSHGINNFQGTGSSSVDIGSDTIRGTIENVGSGTGYGLYSASGTSTIYASDISCGTGGYAILNSTTASMQIYAQNISSGGNVTIYHNASGHVTIYNATISAGTTSSSYGVRVAGTSNTILNLFNCIIPAGSGRGQAAVANTGSGSVINFTGTITGGDTAGIPALLNGSTGTLSIIGDITGGTNATAYGVQNSSTGICSVAGTLTASTAPAFLNATTGVVYFQGTENPGGYSGSTSYITTNIVMPKQAGSWNSAATWYGDAVPGSNAICIMHIFSIQITSNFTVDKIIGLGSGTVYCSTDNVTIQATTSIDGNSSNYATNDMPSGTFMNVSSDGVTIKTPIIIATRAIGLSYTGTTGKVLTLQGIEGTPLVVGGAGTYAGTCVKNVNAGTINITGNVLGGSSTGTTGIMNTSSGTIFIAGNVTGGSGAAAIGVKNNNISGNITINGYLQGGTGGSSNGLENSGTATITGTIEGQNGSGLYMFSGSLILNNISIIGGISSNVNGVYCSGGSVSITGASTIVGGTNSTAYGIYIIGTNVTANITATIPANNKNAHAIYISSSSSVNFIGDIYGSSVTNVCGIYNNNTGYVSIQGDITGGSGGGSYGFRNQSTGPCTICGNLFLGYGSTDYAVYNTTSGQIYLQGIVEPGSYYGATTQYITDNIVMPIASGDWNNNFTWKKGIPPTNTDICIIPIHSVTVTGTVLFSPAGITTFSTGRIICTENSTLKTSGTLTNLTSQNDSIVPANNATIEAGTISSSSSGVRLITMSLAYPNYFTIKGTINGGGSASSVAVYHNSTGTINIEGNLTVSSTATLIVLAAAGTLNINGTITGGSARPAISDSSGGTINLIGNSSVFAGTYTQGAIYLNHANCKLNGIYATVTGGTSGFMVYAIYAASNCVINIGSVSAGTAMSSNGIYCGNSSSIVTIYGTATGTSAASAINLSNPTYLNNIGTSSWALFNHSTFNALNYSPPIMSGITSKNYITYNYDIGGGKKFAYQLSSSRFKKGVMSGDREGTCTRKPRRSNNANIGSVMGSF